MCPATNPHEKARPSIFKYQIRLARDSNSNLPAEKGLEIHVWFGPALSAGGGTKCDRVRDLTGKKIGPFIHFCGTLVCRLWVDPPHNRLRKNPGGGPDLDREEANHMPESCGPCDLGTHHARYVPRLCASQDRVPESHDALSRKPAVKELVTCCRSRASLSLSSLSLASRSRLSLALSLSFPACPHPASARCLTDLGRV